MGEIHKQERAQAPLNSTENLCSREKKGNDGLSSLLQEVIFFG